MGETQGKKRGVVWRVGSCLTLLVLSGACQQSPRMDSLGPNYEPLSSDVAALAAPAPAPAAPPVYCSVSGGSAYFPSGWKNFQQADFTLPADTRIEVGLAPRRGREGAAFQAYFDSGGQKMVFCPHIDIDAAPPDTRVACASLYALDDDLETGIKRTFDVPRSVQGAAITCARQPGQLRR